jgi:hypothetical protein
VHKTAFSFKRDAGALESSDVRAQEDHCPHPCASPVKRRPRWKSHENLEPFEKLHTHNVPTRESVEYMRTTHFQKLLCAFAAATLSAAVLASADEVTTTTTSAGTISEFSPDSIVIRSETASEPIRYSSTKTTTYVDDTGAPVAMDVIKSGVPVTVHYIHEGDRVVADRVIVHRHVTTAAPAGVVEERHTTTAAPGVVEERRTTTAPVVPAAPVIQENKTTTTTTTTDGKPSHEERKAEKEERKAEKHQDKADRELDKAETK